MTDTGIATGTMEVPAHGDSSVFWLEVGGLHGHASYVVTKGVKLLIGASERCDVVLRDRTVSKSHCEVGYSRDTLWVRDLGSKNGVFAGGARVEQALLSPGSCFTVGRVPVCIRRGRGIPEAVEPLPGVVGTSAPMMQVAARVRRLARTSVPVLIRGATGTGKEVVARAVHALSPRAYGPFVDLNMGAIPASLTAAELFGHDRGAFTGAGQARRGAFQAADGGTLFLDEIAEAPSDVQVHLLRALEQRQVQPLGSDKRVHVDVRVVAATWVQLEQAAREGRFRQDLMHRLAVMTVDLPPLSARKSDIGALASHILAQHRGELGDKQIAPAALGRLLAYDWPGNVRELSNVVRRAAVLTDHRWIQAVDVDAALGTPQSVAARASPAAARALVRQCRGNVSAAAKLCGVPRSTFRGWLEDRQAKRGGP